jgi:hypothetical protein
MKQKMNDASKSKSRHGVTLMDEGWNGVQFVAKSLGVSVSELLERVGRRQLVVMDSEELEDLLDTIDGLEGLPPWMSRAWANANNCSAFVFLVTSNQAILPVIARLTSFHCPNCC